MFQHLRTCFKWSCWYLAVPKGRSTDLFFPGGDLQQAEGWARLRLRKQIWFGWFQFYVHVYLGKMSNVWLVFFRLKPPIRDFAVERIMVIRSQQFPFCSLDSFKPQISSYFLDPRLLCWLPFLFHGHFQKSSCFHGKPMKNCWELWMMGRLKMDLVASGRLVFIHGKEPFLVPGQDDPRCFTISMLNLGEMNFESLNSP